MPSAYRRQPDRLERTVQPSDDGGATTQIVAPSRTCRSTAPGCVRHDCGPCRIPLLSAVGPASSNRDTSDVIPAARSKGPVIWDANRYHHGTTTRRLAWTSLYRMNLEVGLSVRRAFARVATDNLVEGGGFHVHQCELLPAHDATAPFLVHSGGRGQLWDPQTTIAIHGRAPRP